ncbi:hypothetical protein PAL_GLEAN10009267 [Pteropus alecto]|uniref:Uncharacterized protein n=1 Tax=Pteropus alecto TaxID=9402 RepID=L5KUM0_PTEAL|nr:hypothetical protein PAL_GLEAN10009267 [Pteropus alecto]
MQAASLAHTERPLLVKEHQLPVAGGSRLASDPQPALSLPTGVGLDGRRNRCSIRQKNNSLPPNSSLWRLSQGGASSPKVSVTEFLPDGPEQVIWQRG